MTELSRTITVTPIIKYPREAQVGRTYLMTIDLQFEKGFEWQYEEEEYPIYCSVNSDLFNSKPVGEPVILLHRFGGSYGEVKFLLTAATVEREGRFKVILNNRWGVLIKSLSLLSVVSRKEIAPLPVNSSQASDEQSYNMNYLRKHQDMGSISQQEIINFVEKNISKFHQSRINRLKNLDLKKTLRRKNPYLFIAKNVATTSDLVNMLLDTHLSSSEEMLFGVFLEELAVFICKNHGGEKSSFEGIDLEFERDSTTYIISIKSGPNWGNSSQVKRMIYNFNKAKKVLETNSSSKNVVAINGCLYGQDNQSSKGEYLKLCGQRFWEFISGDELFYSAIIDLLSYKAKEHNEQFQNEFSRIANKFTLEFTQQFCDFKGQIDWQKLIQFSSSK